MAKRRSHREHWLNRDLAGMPYWAGIATLCLVAAMVVYVVWHQSQPEPVAQFNPPSATAAPTESSEPPPISTPMPDGLRLAIIGDSYTYGLRASSVDASWPRLVESTMRWPVSTHAISGSGYTVEGPSAPGVFGDRVESAASHNADVIVIQGSINDLRADGVREAAEETLSDVREQAPDARCVAVGPTYIPQEEEALVDDLHEVLAEAATAAGCDYLDAREWVPQDAFADGAHPNDEGYAAFADSFTEALTGLY